MRVAENVVNRKKGAADVETAETSPLVEASDSSAIATNHTNTSTTAKGDDNKEGTKDPLTKINLVLTVIVSVLFIFVMLFSSREKKNAYMRYKMAQVEAMARSMTEQKNALYQQYDELSSTIAEQVGLVKLAHHESEVENLKDSHAKMEARLKVKQTSIEMLQEEIKKNKDELYKVSTKLMETEMAAYDFCPKCPFTGIPGLNASCQLRADYIAGKGVQAEMAKLSVMGSSPSCRKPRNPQSQPVTTDTPAAGSEDEEAMIAKFCSSCTFKAIKGLKATCGERTAYLMNYGAPEKVVKLSVMKADPGCKNP